MKRVLVVLLVLVMVFAMTACGDNVASNTDEQTEAPQKLADLLAERNVPELKTRDEMLNVLQDQVYGKLPPKPEEYYFVEEKAETACGGKAKKRTVYIRGTLNGESFGFRFDVAWPTAEGTHPFFVSAKFSANFTDSYQPTEELIDNGYAVLWYNYENVTADNSDFTDGVAGALYPDGTRANPDDPGKIAIWAWAAHRILDYAFENAEAMNLDTDRAVMTGHSRLGKTALLAAATDERFAFAYSNDSGSSGAALGRGKTGEDVDRIYGMAYYWFCQNYGQYRNNEEAMPFDQHYLIASIAPRHVLVGSGSEDTVADPLSELLGTYAASPAWENGLSTDTTIAVGEAALEGDIAYHLRKGGHAFTRQDWHRVIEFVNKHSEK